MTDHRHTYTIKTKGTDAYHVTSRPKTTNNTGVHRDDALHTARDPHAYVTITACKCGDCGLSKYARRHPRSILAARIKVGEK